AVEEVAGMGRDIQSPGSRTRLQMLQLASERSRGDLDPATVAGFHPALVAEYGSASPSRRTATVRRPGAARRSGDSGWAWHSRPAALCACDQQPLPEPARRLRS